MRDTFQKQTLLSIARRALEEYFYGTPLIPSEEYPFLKEKRALFVTLRKNGRLRGCIGTIMADKALMESVPTMTLHAALEDSRFSPLTSEELQEITIEISLLTTPKKISSIDEILLGVDGVIVKYKGRQGLFLPQVAQETGWSKEEFLAQLCRTKAGLSPNAWQDPDVDLYTFQAEFFSEEDVNL
jgi:AmmeMemoRadiSam system protein A